MRTRSGFTLVELMVALILTLAVCGVTYRILLTSQQVSRTQSEHVGMQDNVRAGGLIVSNELRELGYDSIPIAAGLGVAANAVSDLQTIQAGRLRYNAMRALGFTCAAPTSTQVKLRRTWYNGLRDPLTTDSIAVFVDGDATANNDDAWVHAKVTAVTTAATCTDGTAAIQLAIAYPGAINGATVAGKMIVGGPVRIFEVMELRYYGSRGSVVARDDGGEPRRERAPAHGRAAGGQHRRPARPHLRLLGQCRQRDRRRGQRPEHHPDAAGGQRLCGPVYQDLLDRRHPQYDDHDRVAERAPSMTRPPHEESCMRTPKLTDRRGMALAVAIFALVVVGALVAGAFFAGHLEQRTGRNTVYAAQATDAAEAGLANVVVLGCARSGQRGHQ